MKKEEIFQVKNLLVQELIEDTNKEQFIINSLLNKIYNFNNI